MEDYRSESIYTALSLVGKNLFEGKYQPPETKASKKQFVYKYEQVPIKAIDI